MAGMETQLTDTTHVAHGGRELSLPRGRWPGNKAQYGEGWSWEPESCIADGTMSVKAQPIGHGYYACPFCGLDLT